MASFPWLGKHSKNKSNAKPGNRGSTHEAGGERQAEQTAEQRMRATGGTNCEPTAVAKGRLGVTPFPRNVSKHSRRVSDSNHGGGTSKHAM